MKSTSDCIKCNNCEVEELNKAEVYIICLLTGKRYLYGQKIPCDEKISSRKENK